MRGAKPIVRMTSVTVLLVVVVVGLFGPQTAISNLAVLVVWVGWWAGYTMSVYLLGNSWPTLNPWKALATKLPRRRLRPYPARLGAWPGVAGLLGVVWLEVTSPLSEEPRLLALAIVGYTVLTLVGAAIYGVETWFGTVDPIARVFRYYGHIAPIRRTATGFALGLPGGSIPRTRFVTGTDEVAFVLALLWGTTYDGLVSTPTWATVTRAFVTAGVPALVAYSATLLAGFGAFFFVYRIATRLARRTANSYVTPREIGNRFAPSLLPIAAGYHLAHFLGYVVSLFPALVTAVSHPLRPSPTVHALALPDWFGILGVVFVLVGHLAAVWIAHATAFELFAGRLQPIRSQYPFIVVMILYTMTSLWILTQPYTPPPYL